jgi:hypothetical protein
MRRGTAFILNLLLLKLFIIIKIIYLNFFVITVKNTGTSLRQA